ncbi:phospholipase-like protein [Tanacetum coccineum]
MSDFYDVKISVRSSVKLLPEIKGLLLVKRNRERLFRGTVFGPWLDIQSHDNDSHMMHYVLQHQVLISNFQSDSPPLIFHIGDHWLEFENKTTNGFKRITGFDLLRVLRDNKTRLQMLDEDAVRLCLLIASELVFMGKEKRNFLTKHIMWLVDDFDAWNDFPWGEYMWDKFYQRTVNVVFKHTEYHLAELKKTQISMPHTIYTGLLGHSRVANQDGKFIQDDEARVNCIEHNNRMCGDTEVGNFMQVEEVRVNGIEHQHGMCGDTEDGNFVEGIDETICLKTNQMSVKEGDGVLDSEGDGVHLSQTNDVIQEAEPSSSSSHLGNDKDASHLDDLMEIDGENVKDGYTNSQDHLHLLIKALESKTENPTLDVVVPPKDDDSILHTIKPNDAYDVVEVDTYDDDYMLMLIDEEKPVKSCLNDMELEQESDKIDIKQGILEQLNAPKVNTTIFEETVRVKVEDKPGLRRGLGPLKVKKNNCQRALRPNYVLRPLEADWAIVSPHFSTCILSGMMPDYFSNGHMYPLPWQAVKKVYFPVNEPKTHWCLAELEIRTGVVAFYDSLGWAGGSRRRWWRRIKKLFPEKLSVYLVMHGIFQSKGISADDYKITYKYVNAPFQASLFGECRIWVCIFIYRLFRNLPLIVDDPLETALAYCERMLVGM